MEMIGFDITYCAYRRKTYCEHKKAAQSNRFLILKYGTVDTVKQGHYPIIQ